MTATRSNPQGDLLTLIAFTSETLKQRYTLCYIQVKLPEV